MTELDPKKPRFESFASKLSQDSRFGETVLTTFLQTGGLPGICFKRDAQIRSDLFGNHLDTLLSRDIQLISQTKMKVAKLRELFSLLSESQGAPTNRSELARQVGTSVPTLQKTLDAMEGLFLVRPHGQTYYAEDQGLATFSSRLLDGAFFRQDMLRLLFHELRVQLGYLHRQEAFLGAYSTRGGVDVPFVIRLKGKPTVAITVENDELASQKSLTSLTWFKKRHPHSLTLVLHRGTRHYVSPAGTLCAPWTWFF